MYCTSEPNARTRSYLVKTELQAKQTFPFFQICIRHDWSFDEIKMPSNKATMKKGADQAKKD